MHSVRKMFWLLAVSSLLGAGSLEEARLRYGRCDYDGALAALAGLPRNAETIGLEGKIRFRKGQFEQAEALFRQASGIGSPQAVLVHWMGRAIGRRAERANPFRQAFLAVKTREAFELAVELDPGNTEAVLDLFTYYVMAPGFMGGGLEKAEQLAERALKPNREADYFAARAEIAEKRNQREKAEQSLRRAVELEPTSVGRAVDLARFLARQGRWAESEAEFQRAARLDPERGLWMYAWAEALTEGRREPEKARTLLDRFSRAPCVPDDPTPEDARRLRKKLEASSRR